ncbi:hypothetical protein J437_LFUL011295 [Ladona fulva]|uniref:C-CAP/cofactor C-like domain-containing protein n=1 Tax=Ladona fulva TaxID=123851 RepID=A0A8K0KLY6_LADFU|nr:hypothetical protein J437_LFUL011295 [Ladona fulva]
MGNLYSRLTKSNSGASSPCEEIKDKYPKPNLKDYSLNDLNNQIVGKMPGYVNGQQFLIHNCIGSVIYIFDHMNTVTIDDCSNCAFILGPVKESLFIRDCENCICIAASGQFRARDCRSLDLFLCCPTQPTIESSFKLKFNCLQLYYHDFMDHMKMARLSQFNNVWSCVHDFTPYDGKEGSIGGHWSISGHESEPCIPLESHEDFSRVGLSFSREKSVVPHTISPSAKEINLAISQRVHLKISACLIVFVKEAGDHHNVAMEFTRAIQTLHPNCSLTSSKEVYMKADHPFARNTFGRSFDGGMVVGLRFFGPCCWEICQEEAGLKGKECEGVERNMKDWLLGNSMFACRNKRKGTNIGWNQSSA